MTIHCFHPGKADKTMACSICAEQRKLLFSCRHCRHCQSPVCADCGLLELPDPPRLVALVYDLKHTEVAKNPLCIDMEEWIGAPDDSRQRFLCPDCSPENVLQAAKESGGWS